MYVCVYHFLICEEGDWGVIFKRKPTTRVGRRSVCLCVPFFDLRKGCDFTGIDFPMIRLEVVTLEHILKHLPVLVRIARGKIGHQVNIHFEPHLLNTNKINLLTNSCG